MPQRAPRTQSPRIAIVGLGACLPDAPDVATFWRNILANHSAIGEVPPERWSQEIYYDAARQFMDRSYSRIGGFIRYDPFDARRFRLMPRSLPAIDTIQKLSLVAVAEALTDANLAVFANDAAGRAFNRERCAVILGNAMGGEAEDRSSLRVWLLEVLDEMKRSAQSAGVDAATAQALADATLREYGPKLPKVTEDTMPGELSNCIAGRITNVFDLQGPNYTCDAACASSFAALEGGVRGLQNGDFDMAIVGGADRSMDPPTFVKFSRIGALSAEHSAPFDARANGFVMGEGVGVAVLKRLEDAQADGDDIKAVICGVGGSSDGRGKALTAPNPRGQRLAVERAWQQAGFPLESVGLIEAHGTGTPVGDAVEAEVLTGLLEAANYAGPPKALGSVKSMIGHLKSAAGAAALIKTVLALKHRMLPPSANFERAKEGSAIGRGKLSVVARARPWEAGDAPRRAGISAFGFGGTNFHVVLEEAPATSSERTLKSLPSAQYAAPTVAVSAPAAAPAAAMVALHDDVVQLFAEHTGYDKNELDVAHELEADLGIDSVKQAEILAVLRERYSVPETTQTQLSELNTLTKVVAFLRENSAAPTSSAAPAPSAEPVVAPPAAPIAALTAPAGPQIYAFGASTRSDMLAMAARLIDAGDAQALADARAQAHQSPVRLAFAAHDLADAKERVQQAGTLSARLLNARGIFLAEGDGLAVTGKTAFIFPGQGSQYLGMLQDLAAQHAIVRDTFAEADEALAPFLGGKLTDIVWPQSRDDAHEESLRQTQNCQPAMLTADVALARLMASYGVIPDVVAGHSLGEYAAAVVAGVLPFADALYAVSARGREMANVKVDDPGRMAMVAAPAHVVEATLASIDGYVIAANKNCFTQTVIAGATAAVDAAIAAFGQAGIEARGIAVSHAFHSAIVAPAAEPLVRVLGKLSIQAPKLPLSSNVDAEYYPSDRPSILTRLSQQLASPVQFIDQVQRLYADGARIFVECGPKRATTSFVRNILGDKPYRALASNHPKRPAPMVFGELLAALVAEGVAIAWQAHGAAPGGAAARPASASLSRRVHAPKLAPQLSAPVGDDAIVISGTSVLLPGGGANVPWQHDAFAALLRGDNCISPIDARSRHAMRNMGIVRLEKNHGRFVKVDDDAHVPQLAAQLGALDLPEWGIDPTIADALDVTGRLAVAAGIDALRDAGLPLVEHLRTTSTGTALKDRMGLPRAVGERTGVILASAFPSLEAILADAAAYASDKNVPFDRKWLFRALPMGHAQLAQLVLAQGPTAQVNAACASGTQALGMASDWIRLGRCDRVIVVSADDITAQHSLPWVGAGFLAAGAASTEADVAKAAAPFAAHRNGLLLGSGAAAFVVERAGEVARRGLQPIAELVACEFGNSAFHATRLEGGFISAFLARVVAQLPGGQDAAGRAGLAARLAFLSHETYTPARGGSAAAEVQGLRHVFGDAIKMLRIANTKGHTGHPMGASFEDVVAIKGLQRQCLPPIANLVAPDPDFADLNFSRGGSADIDYTLRFAAGFGSQIAAAAYRRVASEEARLQDPARFAAWCQDIGLGEDARFVVRHRQLQHVRHGGAPIETLGIASLARLSAAAAVPAAVAIPSAPAVAPATVTAPAPAAAAAAAAHGGNADAMLNELTALFAEQTGYDTSDLHPDHAIEADLGVDSVKQAEVLAIVRERYNIAADTKFDMAQLQTLRAMAAAIVQTGAGAAPTAMPPAAAPAAPAPRPVPAIAQAANDSDVLAQLTRLFADETGYDLADLHPDHALEADLGIDSVKQAELMAKMRTDYRLPEDPHFRLADMQTLRSLAAYVSGQRQQTPPPAAAATLVVNDDAAAAAAPVGRPKAPAPVPHGVLSRGNVSARAVRLLPMAAPKLDDTPRAWLWSPLLPPPATALQSDALRAAAVRAGLVLTADGSLQQPGDGHVLLDATAAAAGEHDGRLPRAAALFALARMWAQSNALPRRVCVVAGGAGLGFAADADADAAVADVAALAGVVKTLAREWPNTQWTLVSVAALPAAAHSAAWTALGHAVHTAAHAKATPAMPWEWVVRFGGADNSAPTVQWATPARAAAPLSVDDAPLAAHSLVVATGGARGVTFALLDALARRRPLDIVILARSAAFSDGEDVLQGATDNARRAHAKQVLSAQHARVTPAMVKQWLAQYDARREVTDNLVALRATGSHVTHLSCDVSQADARAAACQQIVARARPVSLLLHGAGIEESRFLKDKAEEDFARILAPKWDALVALEDALSPARTVTMGSIAGRFGNAGQADYAAANNALAARARTRAGRMLSVAWTAWDGAGMATRGSVRRVLESHGISLLPLEVGVALGAALIESNADGEVVVAGALGALAQGEPALPAAFDDVCWDADSVTLTRTFSPTADAGLNDHRIDGVAVLPGVLGVELMQQASQWVLGHPVASLCDVSFRTPVKFFHDRPLALDVVVERRRGRDAHAFEAKVRIVTTFVGPAGRGQRREHFTAHVPSDAAPATPQTLAPLRNLVRPALPPLSRDDIYRRYFHGPSFQVLAAAPTLGDQGIAAATVPQQTAWAANLSPEALATAPYAREAAFQAAGLFEMVERDHMALPSAIERLWLSPTRPSPGDVVVIDVRCRAVDDDGCTFDIVQRVQDADGRLGRIIDVMQGYRSIVLRPLREDETFRAPPPPDGDALPEASLALADVEPLLSTDAAETLSYYLSPDERRQLADLKVKKRRLDWLAGRIVAKRCIVQSWRHGPHAPACHALSIDTGELGEPLARLHSPARRAASLHASPSGLPRLSISHGAKMAMAVCSWDETLRPGIDVQAIKRRDPSFAKTYFTEAEQAAVQEAAAHPGVRAEQCWTVRWALKEATLKALGIGARVDFADLEAMPVGGENESKWQVSWRGEAEAHASSLGAEVARAEVDIDGERIVARMTLRCARKNHGSRAKTKTRVAS